MKKSLIYLDAENIPNSIDLLEVADLIHGKGNVETYAVRIGKCPDETDGNFDVILNLPEDSIQSYDVMNLTNCLEELHRIHGFDSILIPATPIGRMLAPRLSMRLHVGLVADVTAIDHNEGNLEMVRPAYSGKIMAGIVNKGRVPIMMSIRQNIFQYTSIRKKITRSIDVHPTTIQPSTMSLLYVKVKEKTDDIKDAAILISGGGGVLDHFSRLGELADELHAQVSASRRIIDSGLATRKIQVGQSGNTVSPKLYIALGIYGSLQHIEGLKNVENIISVNIDKDAPICSLSDIVVEGDAIEFIQKLVEKIRHEKI
ncbi:MAG: electron transfer flavoprotein subunit alpha/FixB family protein [Erysipelotrichaceae bacterium]